MTPEKPFSEALAPAAQLLMSFAARDDKDGGSTVLASSTLE